jgi:hypothetical protein
MERNLLGLSYGYKGCKLFVIPPLPDPPAPIKAWEVYPEGSRGNYSPGRNNLAKGQYAERNREKTVEKKTG